MGLLGLPKKSHQKSQTSVEKSHRSVRASKACDRQGRRRGVRDTPGTADVPLTVRVWALNCAMANKQSGTEGRRGPKPKGVRKQFSVSFPAEDLELYKKRADELGMPAGDYIAAACAREHGRPEPEWVKRRWPYNDDQPELLSA